MIGHIGDEVAGRWPARSFWYLALLDLRSSHRYPGRDVDEWPGFIEQRLDLAPLAHEHFELVERVKGLVAAEDDHAGAAAKCSACRWPCTRIQLARPQRSLQEPGQS